MSMVAEVIKWANKCNNSVVLAVPDGRGSGNRLLSVVVAAMMAVAMKVSILLLCK